MSPETANGASVTTDPIRNQGPTPGDRTMVLFPHHPTPALTAAARSTKRESSTSTSERNPASPSATASLSKPDRRGW